jgi:N6-L-threonylcarbamoyladenine synthase
MIILGLETSCDDTCASVFDGQNILSNITYTQVVHQQFGGIVPELASRAHVERILPVIRLALTRAGVYLSQIEGIAVTFGPGLVGSLLVGLSVAKGMALALQIPWIGINHLEGHIWSVTMERDLKPPFIVLIVSGGHTQTVHVRQWGHYQVLGQTRDDAAGEAFDKVSKLMNLGFPGGPIIEKIAASGNAEMVRFPRAYLEEGSLDFSFSGLKTAVFNYIHNIGQDALKKNLSHIAASFQEAVIDVLVQKLVLTAQNVNVQRICLAGGVAVNKALQTRLLQASKSSGLKAYWPPPQYCTDNGAMIAKAGFSYLKHNIHSPWDLSPNPSLNLS